MEIQFWGGMWTGEDYRFIMKTHQKNIAEDATTSRINIIQAMQTNWIYQIMLEIYFCFEAVEHFVTCAYRASWNLGSEGCGGGERKRSGSRGNVPAYIKLAPQISILYWIQIKVQFSLLSYLDLFAHHASQKHMYFYWLLPHHYVQFFCCIVALISSAQLTLLIFPASITHFLCFSQPPARYSRESVRVSAQLTNTYTCEEFTHKDNPRPLLCCRVCV